MYVGLINVQRAQWAVMILTEAAYIVHTLYGDDKLSLGNEQGKRENKGKDIPLVGYVLRCHAYIAFRLYLCIFCSVPGNVNLYIF